jgi:hypothetical protein
MTRKSPKKPAKTRREVKRFTSLPATQKGDQDGRCDHEPDFTAACITLRENESCDVGVDGAAAAASTASRSSRPTASSGTTTTDPA